MAKVLLKNVRLAFPDLFQPGKPLAGSTNPPKYGASFIFAPGSDAAKVAQAEFLRVAQEKFGPNAAAIVAELPKDKKCIRRGDGNLTKEGEVRTGFAGMLYIVARNKTRPLVIDRNKSPLTEADGKPYGGCYVNATIDIYPQDKVGQGKSINATLTGVQFVSDGESFGGSSRPATPDEFDDLGDDGDAPASSPATAADLF